MSSPGICTEDRKHTRPTPNIKNDPSLDKPGCQFDSLLVSKRPGLILQAMLSDTPKERQSAIATYLQHL